MRAILHISGNPADIRRAAVWLEWSRRATVTHAELLCATQPAATPPAQRRTRTARAGRRTPSWSPTEPTSEDWWADSIDGPASTTASPHRHGAQTRVSPACRRRHAECPRCLQQMRLEGWVPAGGVGRRRGGVSHAEATNKLAKPGCDRLGNEWDACGVYYTHPIDGAGINALATSFLDAKPAVALVDAITECRLRLQG